MNKIIKIIFVCIMLFIVTGCGKSDLPDYKLVITESSWSGWEKDYKPKEKTTKHEILSNKKYVIGRLTFNITKINKDSIEIKTTDSFSSLDTGIDLGSTEKEFTVNAGKTLKLTTPTTDAGNIYYLSLEKNE